MVHSGQKYGGFSKSSKSRREIYQDRKREKGPTNDVLRYIFAEAEMRGLRIERAPVLVGSRNWGLATRKVLIEGALCVVHVLEKFRKDSKGAFFSDLTLSPKRLFSASYVLVVRNHPENGREIFIVPARVLLAEFSSTTKSRCFLIWHKRPDNYRVTSRGRVRWFDYLNAWHLFSTPLCVPPSAVRG